MRCSRRSSRLRLVPDLVGEERIEQGWRIDKAGRADKIDAVIALCMALDRTENRPAPTRLVGWL